MFSVLHLGNCERLMLQESWAEGVETIVTNDRYKRFDAGYFKDTKTQYNGWNAARQEELPSTMDEYTPIVIDLVDNYDQNAKIGNNRPKDRVWGYSLRQIQTSLHTSRGPHTWKERIKSQHSNSTEGFVDELFNVYMYDNCK